MYSDSELSWEHTQTIHFYAVSRSSAQPPDFPFCQISKIPGSIWSGATPSPASEAIVQDPPKTPAVRLVDSSVSHRGRRLLPDGGGDRPNYPSIIHLASVVFALKGLALQRSLPRGPHLARALVPTEETHGLRSLRLSRERRFELSPEMLLKDLGPWPSKDDLFLNFATASSASFDHLGSYKKLNTSY